MTLQTLSDDILANLICRQCYLYLSVGPVTIDKRCGRCSNTYPKTSPKSLFCIISESFLFRCSNHLSGCKEVLVPEVMATHERNCCYKTVQQECFFCSFSGNFMQIYNHSFKDHPGNTSLNGVVSIPLGDLNFKTTILSQQHTDIFLFTFELKGDGQLGVLLQLLQKNSPSTITQYSLSFYQSLESNLIINDFGVFNEKSENYFTKSWQELVNIFGTGVVLYCRIHIGKVSLELIEKEIIQRNLKLNLEHDLLSQLTISQNDISEELETKANTFTQVLKIIKILSHTFFKCSKCCKIVSTDLYYCKNYYFFCKPCLILKRSESSMNQEYTRLSDFKNILVTCDYPRCNSLIPIANYPEHKALCPKRSYKCPLEGCNKVIVSAQKFIQHWHCNVSALYVNENEEGFLKFELNTNERFFWLIKGNLYRVLLQINKNKVVVLINECSVVSRNISFKLECFSANVNENIDELKPLVWEDITVVNFWEMVVIYGQKTSYKQIKLLYY